MLEGYVYDLEEMKKVDKVIAPTGFQQMSGGSDADNTWSIEALLSSHWVFSQ